MFRKLTMTFAVVLLAACSQTKQFNLPETSNDFLQNITYNNKVDVIFIVDNSSSMELANQKLGNAVPGLVQALIKQKLDLHVAVITTSMGGANANGGRFLGSPVYLTSSTPNLAVEVVNRIGSVGNDGSDLERGLDSLAKVLSPSYLAGEGRGFLRNDALLALITLSTEDDKGSNISGGANGYASFLDSVKGFYEDGGRQWILNFIGVLSLSGNCKEAGNAWGYMEPGLRWMSLASLTGGIQASVCSADLTSAATNIRARISQILTDFRLSKKPDEATIVVRVNGAVVPRDTTNGWDYIADKNLIRFYGSAIPAADASINIDFKPAAAN